jgi:cobalt/nickel transport system permease protein
MHIPDGFLDVKTWVTTSAIGAVAVSYALRKTKLHIEPQQVPQIALTGAFIFAAQMINFPVMGATSGHFLGGALAAMLFGPWIGTILMTCVLITQALIFQDGGITVLGANILCTGVVGSWVGYTIYRIGSNNRFFLSPKWMVVFAFVSGWTSIVAAALGVASLLAISGTVSWSIAWGAMFTWHSIIGIGEGLITSLVYVYLIKRNWVFKPFSEKRGEMI